MLPTYKILLGKENYLKLVHGNITQNGRDNLANRQNFSFLIEKNNCI